jgi:hypothetical protein
VNGVTVIILGFIHMGIADSRPASRDKVALDNAKVTGYTLASRSIPNNGTDKLTWQYHPDTPARGNRRVVTGAW